jgi:hypothetical protein
MKKMIVIFMTILFLFPVVSFAIPVSGFTDTETITVNGNRPNVSISASTLTVTVDPENFDASGVAEKTVTISNDGNVTVYLTAVVSGVPADLAATARLNNTTLTVHGTTQLTIRVILSAMQTVTPFTFTVKVTATR